MLPNGAQRERKKTTFHVGSGKKKPGTWVVAPSGRQWIKSAAEPPIEPGHTRIRPSMMQPAAAGEAAGAAASLPRRKKRARKVDKETSAAADPSICTDEQRKSKKRARKAAKVAKAEEESHEQELEDDDAEDAQKDAAKRDELFVAEGAEPGENARFEYEVGQIVASHPLSAIPVEIMGFSTADDGEVDFKGEPVSRTLSAFTELILLPGVQNPHQGPVCGDGAPPCAILLQVQCSF